MIGDALGVAVSFIGYGGEVGTPDEPEEIIHCWAVAVDAAEVITLSRSCTREASHCIIQGKISKSFEQCLKYIMKMRNDCFKIFNCEVVTRRR